MVAVCSVKTIVMLLKIDMLSKMMSTWHVAATDEMIGKVRQQSTHRHRRSLVHKHAQTFPSCMLQEKLISKHLSYGDALRNSVVHPRKFGSKLLLHAGRVGG